MKIEIKVLHDLCDGNKAVINLLNESQRWTTCPNSSYLWLWCHFYNSKIQFNHLECSFNLGTSKIFVVVIWDSQSLFCQWAFNDKTSIAARCLSQTPLQQFLFIPRSLAHFFVLLLWGKKCVQIYYNNKKKHANCFYYWSLRKKQQWLMKRENNEMQYVLCFQ